MPMISPHPATPFEDMRPLAPTSVMPMTFAWMPASTANACGSIHARAVPLTVMIWNGLKTSALGSNFETLIFVRPCAGPWRRAGTAGRTRSSRSRRRCRSCGADAGADDVVADDAHPALHVDPERPAEGEQEVAVDGHGVHAGDARAHAQADPSAEAHARARPRSLHLECERDALQIDGLRDRIERDVEAVDLAVRTFEARDLREGEVALQLG
jgi:hypothetical protein